MENTNKISIVMQFTIFINSNYICNFLTQLERMNVKICGFTVIQDIPKKLVLKIIIENHRDNSLDEISIVQNILTRNKLQFSETKVIKVNSDISTLNTNLYYLIKDLDFNCSYLCSDGSIIYETCCPVKAMKLLNNA